MMSYFKKKYNKVLLLLILSIFIGVLAGCNGRDVINQDDLYTVIYDGNGGYLGNKTNTVRKLQVQPGSKIPKYLSEYAQDSYVVSSLGLATRQGYNLLGWYLESNAQFAPNPLGEYVYLDVNDGNGAYNIDQDGSYVFGYVQDEQGTLVFINVEELSEDDDPETAEYIYYNGSNGYGFYVYDAEDAAHVEVYELVGGYAPSELTAFGNAYLVFSELSPTWQNLFVDVPKYKQDFYEYTEADEGLTRYSFESSYIYFDSMMIQDDLGEYALLGTQYVVYDSENIEHTDLERYSVNSRYVFVRTDGTNTPSDLERFNASITYWDFETDRVEDDMTLIAHWERKITVNYIQKSGQITVITKKLSDDNTTSVDLVQGELIGKLETIPKFAGYTFVGWSKSETEYDPWNFESDVFPIDSRELNLYAYMIEGDYTRISTESGLAKVALDPAGNYLLVADIDLGGQTYINSSPLGFTIKTTLNAEAIPFTGKFVSMGYKISNFTLSVTNTQKPLLADEGIIVVSGLFPYVQDATISGLVLENVSAILTTNSGTGIVCDLGAAALIGTALEGNTIVNDVDVEITFSATTSDVIGKPVYIGGVFARGSEFITSTNTTSSVEYSSIEDITSDTLHVSN